MHILEGIAFLIQTATTLHNMVNNKDNLCSAYTDLTEWFLYKSSCSNQYLFTGYYYNANCILT